MPEIVSGYLVLPASMHWRNQALKAGGGPGVSPGNNCIYPGVYTASPWETK